MPSLAPLALLGVAAGTLGLFAARADSSANGYGGVVPAPGPRPSPSPSPYPSPGVAMVTPRGKGIFVRSVNHYGLDWAKTADLIRAYGFRWCALQVLHQFKDKPSKVMWRESGPKLAARLHGYGIQTWIWGWPVRGMESAYLHEMRHRLETSDHIYGVIINAEGSYITPKAKPNALELARGLTALTAPRKLGLGLTSYGGGPASVPAFPWAEFASVPMIGFPQIYDRHNKLGPEYPGRSWQRWAAGFKPICPIWGASDEKTVAQMRAISDRTPTSQAVSWWDLYWLLQSAQTRDPARALFVKNFPSSSSFRFSGQQQAAT